MRNMRKMTGALIVSGTLNIILAGGLFYWVIKERPPTPYYELKPANKQEQQSPLAIDHSNNEVIRYFKKMPMEWLIGRLKNTQLVENGYTQRDLALASLVAFHHFDSERALAGLPLPAQFRDGSPAELIVYPGLSEKHFEAIITFAQTEKWPLTSKGLFLALRKGTFDKSDTTLADTFFMTPEFLAVDLLFGRSDVAVDKGEILDVLLQGNWEMLTAFTTQQRATQDLSPARRQKFLLDYISYRSKAAAYLILKTDGETALRKIDDAQVLAILQMLDEKSPKVEKFAASLLTSPRSDAVWQMAAARLYGYAGESMPEKNQHNSALSRFVPQRSVIQAATTPASVPVATVPPIIPPPAIQKKATEAPPIAAKPSSVKQNAAANTTTKPAADKKSDKLYVVQDGDNLWKIARRFRVDIDVLRAHNKLNSDTLRPGMSMRIPNT